MDSRDVYNLYSAYRSVYEDRESLNEDVDYELQERFKPTGYNDGITRKSAQIRGQIERLRGKGKAFQASEVEHHNKEADTYEGRGGSVAISSANRERGRKQRNEELDLYDVVLDHLLDEGYCDDVESAEVIMANMSEEWLDGILDEAKADKNVPPEQLAKIRNYRSGFIFGSTQTKSKARRAEHKERRGVRGNVGGEGGSSYRYDDNGDKDYPSVRFRGRGTSDANWQH